MFFLPLVTAIETTGTAGNPWEESTVKSGKVVVAVVVGRTIWCEKLCSPSGDPKKREDYDCMSKSNLQKHENNFNIILKTLQLKLNLASQHFER